MSDSYRYLPSPYQPIPALLDMETDEPKKIIKRIERLQVHCSDLHTNFSLSDPT